MNVQFQENLRGVSAELRNLIISVEMNQQDLFGKRAQILGGTFHFSNQSYLVESGSFDYFVPANPDWKMVYHLNLRESKTHVRVALTAMKSLSRTGSWWRRPFQIWEQTTKIRGQLLNPKTQQVICPIELKIHLRPFLVQLASFQVTGAQSSMAKIQAISRFSLQFMMALWRIYFSKESAIR